MQTIHKKTRKGSAKYELLEENNNLTKIVRTNTDGVSVLFIPTYLMLAYARTISAREDYQESLNDSLTVQGCL